MAERIKGLQIDLSMKDMGVSKTLAGIKREFRSLDSSLKLSSNNFKYGEKSAASYKSRMNDLDGAIKSGTTNLNELEKQYNEVSQAQGSNSAKAIRLQTEYNKQANSINAMRDEYGRLNQYYKENFSLSGKLANRFSSIGESMSGVGQKAQDMGSSLTSSITKPALIAGTAMAGITAKLGFDRLVGLDSAKAKLEGLGYSTKEVGSITDQVAKAIQGGMTTMAEGTDVAAGALAAGVKEGKELQKYIKLVGDAAVGSNRPVSEMAMIFNRVQGQGKLMTEELNMVEEGMPGFSNAMAKHLGVSYDAFRKMVTEGEVSSKDFLTVMDDFAGGMAGAYSKSWSGMVQNTKAYIGQIGESLLGGVFEQAKGSLHEFETLLKSPGAQQWAKETGVQLGNAFSAIANGIKGVINWWNSLDGSTQKVLGGIIKWAGLTLIAVGPLLTIFGKIGLAISAMFGPISGLLLNMGKVAGVMKTGATFGSAFASIFPKLGMVLGALTGPIGLTVLAITGIGTALVIAYKKSETFRNIVNGAVSGVVTAFKWLWSGIMTVLTPIGNALASFGRQIAKTFGQFWAENGPQFMQALGNIKTGFLVMWGVIKPIIMGIGSIFKAVFGAIVSTVQFFMPVIQGIFKVGWALVKYIIVSTWNAIKGVINGALNVIMGIVKVFIGLFTGDFGKMWEGVKQIFFGALQFVWNLVQLWFVGKIFGVFKLGLKLIKSVVSGSLGAVRGTFSSILNSIWGIVKKVFGWVSNFMRNIFSNIWKFTKAVWSNIKLAVTNPVALIKKIVPQTFRVMSNIIRTIFNGLKKAVSVIFRTMKTVVVNIAKALSNLLKGNFTGMRKNLQNIVTALKNAVIKLWKILKTTVVNVAKSLWSGIKGIFKNLFNTAKNITQNLKNSVVDKWKSLKKSVINLATGAKDGVVKGFKAMFDKGKEWLNKLKDFIKGAKDGFKKVATDLGKGVANGAISGLNAMIDGINSLSKKIMKKKLIKKNIPKLSTGTGVNPAVKTDSQGRLKRSTKAIVNDKGIGNGKGPNGHKELIYRRSGKIEQPRGNNKKVSLKRGDGVINGAQAKAMRPHLSTGTNLKDELFGAISSGAGKVKDTASKGYHKAKSGAGSLIEGGKDLAGKAKKAFDKTIGDVMEYVKNPMKLIDKTMKFFGVDFSKVEGEAMGGMMDFGYKGLKGLIKDLVEGWFSELEGGDGDSDWLLNGKHPILQTFGRYTGGLMFNGGRHYGMDFGMPTGTKIKALTDGTVTQAGPVSGGGGNQITLKEPGGKWYQWYMHLSKILTKKGAKVKAGDLLGLSGNTGNSTTPHLHIQRMKGYPSNETAVNPKKWLESLKGGGSKSASKWKSDIVRAGKEMGVNLSSGDIKDIIKLIDTESGGRAGVTQSGYTDVNTGGNEARGLLQYTPGSWNSYKKKGKGNILNGYHQLVAFLNNTNWRRDLSSWKSRMARGQTGWGPTGSRRGYATGGLINSSGLYNLAEEGHPEFVIPTDPSRQSDAMKLLAIATQRIEGNKKNKRPNQMRTPSTGGSNSNDNTELLLQMIANQQKQLDALTQIARSNKNIEQQPKGFTERDVSQAQGKEARMMAYNMGGAF